MNYDESYEKWAEEVGILEDSESREAWEHQKEKIDVLKELLSTYRTMSLNDYRWYLVVDSKGNVEEAFNSKIGAEDWVKDHGGIIVKVKEETV